jgi:hypothetical protein
MPLENLFRLVETLSDRIQKYSTALRQSEVLTRYVLIDPLLRELGWDTENPNEVHPEYTSGSGRVDYALLSGGNPIVMIEAKKLDLPLKDRLAQAINYCLMEGTPYFAVTDGRRWEIYETHRPVPIADKQVVAFDLVAPTTADVAFKALALWRLSVETGSMKLPQAPILPQGGQEPLPVDKLVLPEVPQTIGSMSYGGKSITSFTFFGKQYNVTTWRELLITLATNLYDAHSSDFSKVVSLRVRKQIYFSTSPNQMRAPAQVGGSGYYVETHRSANGTVRLCRRLLTLFGYTSQDLHIETR